MAERRNDACGNDLALARRDFLRVTGAGALAASLPTWAFAGEGSAAPAAQTPVQELYHLLSDEIRKKVCFPFSHELRTSAEANWAITEPVIDELPSVQQDLADKILRGIASEEGYEKFITQMNDDAGGLGAYHIAFFGEPSQKDFEFVMTGRHMTIRANGAKEDGVAFGGPMVYGHAPEAFHEKPDHPGNVFWYQAQRANEVFAALDPSQRKEAVLDRAPHEADIDLREKGYEGIQVGSMSSDQKALVEQVLRDLLSPYNERDAAEVTSAITANGGLERLSLAFYRNRNDGKNGDIGKDGVWDIWRMEGPGFVWHFRGSPHVHTWVNIAKV